MENAIMLCSSNATEEYMLDILRLLSKPRGSVIHFRYGKEWVDPELWKALPIKYEKKQRPFLGNPVVSSFVYQENESDEKAVWKHVYPIRLGSIKECYKTGDGQSDKAFFYFELQDFYSMEDDNPELFNNFALSTLWIQDSYGHRTSNRCFASLRQSIPAPASQTSDSSSFHNIVGKLDLDHFKSMDGKTQYYPVFLQILGIDEAMLKGYDAKLRQRYYELTDGNSYTVEANIFLKESPSGTSKVELSFHENQFINSSFTNTIASRYDEFAWRILPGKVIKDIMATISINTKIEPPQPSYHVLNVELPLYIKLKVNKAQRYFETIQDIGLALSTVLIAWVGLLQKTDPTNPILNKLVLSAAILFLMAIFIKACLQLRGK